MRHFAAGLFSESTLNIKVDVSTNCRVHRPLHHLDHGSTKGFVQFQGLTEHLSADCIGETACADGGTCIVCTHSAECCTDISKIHKNPTFLVLSVVYYGTKAVNFQDAGDEKGNACGKMCDSTR